MISIPAAVDPAALKKQFDLSYQIDTLLNLNRLFAIRGCKVLEIGGALPSELVNGVFGAATWIAVDDRSAYLKVMGKAGPDDVSRPVAQFAPEDLRFGWQSFDGRGHDVPTWADGRFDLIVSLATLEHVSALPRLMGRMRSLVRPGGAVWCLVGPIWSGYRGYHVYGNYFAPYSGKTAAFLKEAEPWQHLLMDSMEFYKWLHSRWGAEFADLAHSSIFESPRLNRLMFPDYQAAFAFSGLRTEAFQPWALPMPSQLHFERVQARFPQQRGFEIDGFEILLRRQSSS
jgi:SAM-dependent methyltransferase